MQWASSAIAQLPTGTWQYHWGDEFQGPTLDTTKWSYNYPWGTTHNHLAVMSPNNVLFGDGTLTLRAQRNGSTNNFTSGAISSGYTRFTTDGGYIEARIRLPSTPGSWPAFWGLYDGWPPEADIMEYPIDTAAGVGYARDQYHTAWHYSTGSGNAAGAGQVNPAGVGNLDGAYHTFGMRWTSDQSAAFFFNGQQVSQINNPTAVAQMQRMYLILNYAVGGWPGTPNLSEWGANHFDDMKVDWVRVWKADADRSTTWNYSGTASTVQWDTPGNWSSGAPNLGGVTASFGTRANAPVQNVDWSGRRTMTTMNLDGTTVYQFGGATDRLVMAWGNNGTTASSINIAATSTQSHQIRSELEFVGGLSINNNSNQAFRLSGTIMGQGGLEINGDGAVVFEANNGIYGGSTIIDSGTPGSGIAIVRSQNPFGSDQVIIGEGGNATTGRLELENNSLVSNLISLNGRNNDTIGIQNNSGNNTISGTVQTGLGGTRYRISSDSGRLTLSGSESAGVALTSIASGTRNFTLQGNGEGVVSGNITNGSGTVGIIKEGSSDWSLEGQNTYTGATNITSGTLRVSGAGAINSTSGITINGSNAKYLHTSSVASTRNINLTLGTVDGVGALGAVTVADQRSNIIANGNGGTGALSMGSLAFSGDATVNLSLGSSHALEIVGALSTTVANGTVTINAAKTGWSLGNNNLIRFGSYAGSANHFTLGTVTGLGSRQSGALAVVPDNLALVVSGDLPVWTGLSSSTWTTATTGDHAGPSNWATSNAKTATNFWAADTPQFNDTYDLGSGVVSITNRLVDIQGSNVAPVTLTFNNSNGDYRLSSSTGHGIVGSTGLVKSGSSSLIITNSNSFTGGTTINGGTLQLGDGTTNGSLASNITNNSALAFNVGATQTFGNVISGTGTMTKAGAGTLILTSNNTYTGNTTIDGGTLQIGDGTTNGSLASSVTNNGALAFHLASAQTFGNTISGTGQVSKAGAGTLTLNSSHTYQGGTTIQSGALTISGTGTLGTGSIQIASGATLNINRSYATSVAVSGGGSIISTGTHTVTGDFSGFSGSFIHNTATASTAFNNEVSTSENAAYSVAAAGLSSSQGLIAGGNGNYTLKMGSLSGVANSLVRGGLTATGTTTLEIGNLNTNTTFAGSINNGTTKVIALTKVGSGTLTLSGVNSYTGATNINAGTLAVNGSLSSASVTTVASGGTLNVGATGTVAGNVIVNGKLSGVGALTGAVTFRGTHSVGNSPGLQSFSNITYDGSVFEWELMRNTTANRGVNFDAVNGIGTAPRSLAFTNSPTSDLVFNFAGSTVDWNDPFWTSNQSWTVFENLTNVSGSPFSIRNISADSNNLAFGQGNTTGGSFHWSVNGGSVLLNYSAVAVPEPSTVALLGLMGLGAIVHQRLRTKKARR
jgi:autotransporter-associated beta strand protein